MVALAIGALCVTWCVVTEPGVAGNKKREQPPGSEVESPGHRVLYLGDSMSMGAFGKTLDQELRNAGLEVYTSVTGGATPYYWLSDYSPVSSTIGHWRRTPDENRKFSSYKRVPKVESLIESYNPDMVIVQTGTNMYATLRSKRRSEEANEKEVSYVYKKMCERVTQDGRRCFWITPPSAHEKRYPKELQQKMRDIMVKITKPYGDIYDSYATTDYTDPFPQTDGIHYGPDKARAWAKDVAKEFINYATEGKGVGRRALAVDPSEAVPNQNLVNEDNLQPKEVIGKEPVTVSMRLIAKSIVDDISEVTYRRAIGISEYEVLSVSKGSYPFKKLRLAEFVVEKRVIVKRVVNRRIGKVRDLTLVPLSNYESLERLETVDDLEINFDLPVMIPKFD
jgi:hypothetical protein